MVNRGPIGRGHMASRKCAEDRAARTQQDRLLARVEAQRLDQPIDRLLADEAHAVRARTVDAVLDVHAAHSCSAA